MFPLVTWAKQLKELLVKAYHDRKVLIKKVVNHFIVIKLMKSVQNMMKLYY